MMGLLYDGTAVDGVLLRPAVAGWAARERWRMKQARVSAVLAARHLQGGISRGGCKIENA